MDNGIKPNLHDQDAGGPSTSVDQSIGMLKAVIGGETYDTVAARFAKSRTAVERRIKAVASQLSRSVGIEGLNIGGAAFVSRLRAHREAILCALESFSPTAPHGPRETRILSQAEVAMAVQRIKGRSSRPWHDTALFYMLFCTGARPLEIARLQVRDYLNADSTVRRASQMRPEVAISGKSRPLHFTSTRLEGALSEYLQERLAMHLGVGVPGAYRGLDPDSRLFLSSTGEGFKITPYGKDGQRRFLCRSILDTYAKLFRYSELDGVSALSARRTVIARLYERGADEDQIVLLLGISERSAARELLPRQKPSIEVLVDELI